MTDSPAQKSSRAVRRFVSSTSKVRCPTAKAALVGPEHCLGLEAHSLHRLRSRGQHGIEAISMSTKNARVLSLIPLLR